MDLLNSYKLKLEGFQVEQLQNVLSRIGVEENGLKRDLVARILDLVSAEQGPSTGASTRARTRVAVNQDVADVIDDVHSSILAEVYESELDEQRSSFMEKIFCLCGFAWPENDRTHLIKCENPACGVLQHKTCVLGLRPAPPQFYCESCRIDRADPFWIGRRNLLPTVMPGHSASTVDGINPDEKIGTKLEIESQDLCLLKCKDYEIQVWCILLHDAVPFRMHWPNSCQLKVNGTTVKTVNRSKDQVLGKSGGDDGALIFTYLHEGPNYMTFSSCQHRTYCLGVRLVKPRTIQEVCSLISNKQEAESLNVATARVIGCVGGGAATLEDADRELEVVSDYAKVDLRCPISGARMKIPSRFKSCDHMGCFDLEAFLVLAKTTRKWICPICLKNFSWDDIIVDSYFHQVIRKMDQSGDDATEIRIKPDGSWYAPSISSRKNLMQCDIGSTSTTTNSGATLEDPMIISDCD